MIEAETLLTLARAEEMVGEPASRWHGRCYEIACTLAQHAGGRAVYGIWLGPIHRASRFAGRTFIHHGWILRPAGGVCDPTRFTLTQPDAPAIHYGPEGREYDRGGNRLRARYETPRPGPPAPNEQITVVDFGSLRAAVEDILGWDPANGLSRAQQFWLAKRSPDELGPVTYAVYRAFETSGLVALIPIDNRREVLGMEQ